MDNDYGIVANVAGVDRVFRKGAKCWLVWGTGGEGWYLFQWWGCSRGGRRIQKWSPTVRFTNFRAAWIPDHLKDRIVGYPCGRGTREEMEDLAEKLNEFVKQLR